jgi:hypothetical protein
MLSAHNLMAQGYVVGHDRRSPCRPEPIVQTRDSRTTPTRRSASPINHVSGARAREFYRCVWRGRSYYVVPTHVDSYPLDGLALGILLLLIVFPVVQE